MTFCIEMIFPKIASSSSVIRFNGYLMSCHPRLRRSVDPAIPKRHQYHNQSCLEAQFASDHCLKLLRDGIKHGCFTYTPKPLFSSACQHICSHHLSSSCCSLRAYPWNHPRNSAFRYVLVLDAACRPNSLLPARRKMMIQPE